MKIILTVVAASILAAVQLLADCGSCGSSDKDGCVKGQPCKCADCGQTCGSEACKASNACKGDKC